MAAFSHTTYVKWVQRSINYNFSDCRLIDDGRISPEYRAAVIDVQFENYLPETGDVDARTQDALIKANHNSREYTGWVQKQLNSVLKTSLSSIIIDDPMRSAIRSFQRTYGKLYSGGLGVDGWFGYKTEQVMIEVSKSTPPVRCFVLPDDPVIGTRKCMVRKLPGLKGVTTRNALANCLIKKVLDPTADTEYMDVGKAADVVGAPRGTLFAVDAFVELRQTFEKVIARRRKVGYPPLTCREAENWFVDKAKDLLSGIEGVLVADPLKPQVPQLRKRIHHLSMNRNSVYRCPAALDAVNRMVDKVGKNMLGRYTYRGSVA